MRTFPNGISAKWNANRTHPGFKLDSPCLFPKMTTTPRAFPIYIYIYIYIYIRGAYDKFPDFFVWTLLLTVNIWNSNPLWSNLLRLQSFVVPFQRLLEGPMEVLCVSVSMTFVTASFISSVISKRQPLSLGNNQTLQGARFGLWEGWRTILMPIFVK